MTKPFSFNGLRAIYKRELMMYFKSPIAYILLGLYALVSGLVFSLYLFQGLAMISIELRFLQSLFFILIPLLCMKSFSSEKKNGSLVLLMTAPVRIRDIVLAKYLAAVTLFVISSLPSLLHLVITLLLGGRIDLQVAGTAIAYFIAAFAYIAIAIFCSVISESQLIAAIISMLIFLCFDVFSSITPVLGQVLSSALQSLDVFGFFAGEQQTQIAKGIESTLRWINPSTRISDYARGIFSISPIFFLLSYIVLFLFFTCKKLEKQRWAKS
ncbi:MAG: ABC-2 transporter permease [Eubacteriales bacterium]|nr:ABC-2 transporter permease [Eubacteriales bacterium]